jgi:DNA-binding response OmpR family regulator
MQSRRAAAGAALQAGSAGVVAPVRLILETVGSPRTEAVILLVDPLQGHHDMAWRLTPQEHAALALLLSHEGRLVTRHTLMVRLPCRTSDQVRQPDGVIFRLRRKLTAVGWSGAIKGVWGEGYRLVQPPQ